MRTFGCYGWTELLLLLSNNAFESYCIRTQVSMNEELGGGGGNRDSSIQTSPLRQFVLCKRGEGWGWGGATMIIAE